MACSQVASTRVAVLGDVHANAPALKGALAVADSKGYDFLILMGDLLTYGIDVTETLDVVLARSSRGNAVILRGNHDALYDDLMTGNPQYFSKLPPWIRESVEWTQAHFKESLWKSIAFNDEYRLDSLLFSHANPFGPRRWEYLNTEADHVAAVNTINARQLLAGIFGHTHRTRWFRYAAGTGAFLPPRAGELDSSAVHVLNAGAIGQPRDRLDLNPHVLWLELSAVSGKIAFQYEEYGYDTASHLRGVEKSGMTPETVQKICGFFLPQAPKADGDTFSIEHVK